MYVIGWRRFHSRVWARERTKDFFLFFLQRTLLTMEGAFSKLEIVNCAFLYYCSLLSMVDRNQRSNKSTAHIHVWIRHLLHNLTSHFSLNDRPFKMNTAEAIAACLYIAGFKDLAKVLLDPFGWDISNQYCVTCCSDETICKSRREGSRGIYYSFFHRLYKGV